MKGIRVLSAILLALLQTSLAVSQGTPQLEFRGVKFTSAAGETVDAEMGSLQVPESRTESKSSTIRLPVIRFKSTAAKPGAPIVYLAGGPGASGLASAKEEIFPLLMELRRRADVIVFDQRGTGAAEPSLVIPGKVSLPLEASLEDEPTRVALIGQTQAAVSALKNKGINLSAYNTAENADDVEDLRKSLNAEKVTIWGHSYGTHLGLAFMKRHPTSVDKAVLGSINGLDQRWRYPSNLDELIDRVDEYIVKTPKFRRQLPSMREAVKTVFANLDKKPFVFSSQGRTIKIGKLEIQSLVALRSGDLEFVKMLPMLFGQMQDGDFSFVAPMVAAALKQRDWGTAMAFTMHIASGVGAERAADIAKQEQTALFGRSINYPFEDKEFLAAWNMTDLGDRFREPVKSDIPALFLSATLDGRTSLSDAALVLQGFRNARQIVVEGGSHNFYHLTPAVLTAIEDFLDGKKVPERIVVPFDLRGPGERKLFVELKKIIAEKGIEAAVNRAREWSSPKSDEYLTSYIFGNLGITLMKDDNKPKEALEIFKVGVEIFPDNLFLNERAGDAYQANGMKTEAAAQYEKCLKLNPLNRGPAVKLATLKKEH
ncbi:MAG TPA: alpha/beta fold hydrolase [Pyrinomonadaceae bacterium]|nr:alpha/beta fold hydrolase [Pyrinomonadaceae bacterium]